MKRNSEHILLQQVVDWLRLRYPEIIYRVDYAAGLKMSIGQARRMRRLNMRGFPDLMIFATRGQWHGLAIELKSSSPYNLRSGKLKSDPHLREQEEVHARLTQAGYLARFEWDFDEIRMLIENYLTKKGG